MTPRHIVYLACAKLFAVSLMALSPCPDMEAHKKYEDTPQRIAPQPTQPTYTPPPEKVKCHEKEPDCLPLEVLCDAGPKVCMGSDLYFTGSFIFWWPHQEGTEYAMSGIGTDPNKGDTHDVDYGGKPGFKVGLGYAPPHDGWDLYAFFTWLHASGDDATSADNLSTLVSTFNPTLTGANVDWELKFNTLDLELARNFFVSRYLKIRPFAGVKGTWQDQDYTVNYLTDNVAFGPRRIRIDQDYWGFGIRGGMNSAWHFTNMCSLFGNFAISALWSGYDVDRKDSEFPLGVENIDVETKNNFHTVSPVLELAFGFRFETWFYHEEYHIALDLGWEEQVWWGHNRYITLSQPQHNGGDLTFHGITFTTRFDF